MKITDIRVTPVAVPIKQAGSCEKAAASPRYLTEAVIEIFTDEGIVGIGESPCYPSSTLHPDLLKQFCASLVGKDPTNINFLMKELYAENGMAKLHIHTASGAISGIEMALWDILGKRAGKPLYKVWGGAYRKKLEFAGCVARQEPEAMKQAAADLVAQGYRVISTKVGYVPEEDLAAVAAIRKGVPDPKIKIRLAADQAWSTGTAIRVINEMDQYGIELVEQPVLMYNLDALQMVKTSVRVPISGHECGWTMYEVLNVIKTNAVDYLHVGGRFDAGYNGFRISAGMAEAAGIQCVYHVSGELGISFAMDLHMIAATANCTLASQADDYEDLADDIILGGKHSRSGPYYTVPEGAGLGVAIDPERVAAYHERYVQAVENGSAENGAWGKADAMYLRSYLNGQNL